MNMEMYKSIIDNLLEPVVFVDTTHVIRYLNPAAVQKYANRGYESSS